MIIGTDDVIIPFATWFLRSLAAGTVFAMRGQTDANILLVVWRFVLRQMLILSYKLVSNPHFIVHSS
jgi:hypothetical protein